MNLFNLVEITIKPAFKQTFSVWKISKQLVEKDQKNFTKTIYSAYKNKQLLARAGEDTEFYKFPDWYLLTDTPAERPYSQAQRVTHIDDIPAGITLQLLLNSREFKYDGLGSIRSLDGFYTIAKQSRKEIIAQKMLVTPHPSGKAKAVLLPRTTSFRKQQQQINNYNQSEPKSCYIELEDKIYQETAYFSNIETQHQAVIYKGPLVARTKNSLPWALAKEHRPYEAKNSYLQKVLQIVRNPPFSNWLEIERLALTRKPVGKKQQISKKQRHEEISKWLKSTMTEKYHISFADARSQRSECKIIETMRAFCSEHNYEISVSAEIEPIDIINESTITKTVEIFIKKLSSNCFPIFLVDEKKTGQWDPKPVIDQLLQDIPHHAIANPRILDKPDQNTEVDVILANLIIKKEVISGQLLLNRTGWFRDELFGNSINKYMFCTKSKLVDNVQYAAVHISTIGKLEFFMQNPDYELAEIADKNQWKQVWLDQLPDDTAKETLLIQDQGIRVVPPVSSKKEGWSETAGIYSISEVSGYYASYYERPKDKIEKGIVVREIIRKISHQKFELATQADMENLSQLCIDPYIRLNSATVIPFPYKHLREWIFSKKLYQDESS